jgi:hypothetical protein
MYVCIYSAGVQSSGKILSQVLYSFPNTNGNVVLFPEKQTWETEWCRLAYWELTQRVGRQFGVRVRAVDVYGGGACGSNRHGFCLDALDQKDSPQSEQVCIMLTIDANIFHLSLMNEELDGPVSALRGVLVEVQQRCSFIGSCRVSEITLSRWSWLHFLSLAPTNPHWARAVGYALFSLCVIRNEGRCPSSGDINRLMMMTFQQP